MEQNSPANGHLIGGKSTSLIGADDRGATESLDGRQRPDNGVLLGHTAGTEGQASGDDGRQTFGNGGDGQSYGDLEVVDGALDPGATMSGVVKVTDVDGPDSDADNGDNLGQLLAELVEFLLQRSLDLLGLGHLGTDLTDGGVEAGADDDTAGLAGGYVRTGEQDVLLVLKIQEKTRLDSLLFYTFFEKY